jgi:hypothetical protein
MEQFSLEKYLENPTRKVVTRDGRPVRILCTDAKAKDGCCIIAAIETNGEEEGYQFFKNGKAYSSKSSIEDCADLFFADKEEELTEFEKAMQECYFPELDNSELKRFAKGILNLARKELEANYYTNVIDDRIVFKSELHATDLQTAYDMGKQDALKDLPKWKRATEDKEFDEFVLLFKDEKWAVLTTVIHKGDYYIKLSDLKTLSKEE